MRGGARLGLFVWLLGGSLACGGGDATGPAHPTADYDLVTSYPFEGYVAYVVDATSDPSKHQLGFALLNPRTGQHSPDVVLADISTAGQRFTVSVDGRHVAFATALDEAARTMKIAYGEIVSSAGTPSFKMIKDFVAPASERLEFNAVGDRLFTGAGYYDPTTGEGLPCKTASGVYAFGEHGAIGTCDGPVVVFEDRRPIASTRDEAPGHTADNAWLLSGGGIVAHATGLTHPVKSNRGSTPVAVPTMPTTIPFPDGRVFSPMNARGITGDLSRIVSSTNPDDERLTCITDHYSSPTAGGQVGLYDVRGTYQTPATPPLPVTTSVGDFASSVPAKGTDWRPVALSPDGRYVLFLVRNWDIVDGPRCPINTLTQTTLRRVDLGSGAILDLPTPDSYALVGGPLFMPGSEPRATFSEAEPFGLAVPCLAPKEGKLLCGARELGEDAITGPFGTGHANMIGYDGDAFTSLDFNGVPALDGQTVTNKALEGSTAGQQLICFKSTIAEERRKCIDVGKLVGGVIAVAGHAVDGTPGRPPTVTRLSQTAANVGDRVHVYGYGFGASGSIAVGAETVPASDVTSWSDTEIVVRVGAWHTTTGRVVVTNGSKSSSGRPHYLFRAQGDFTHPLEALDLSSAVLHQGIDDLPTPGFSTKTLGVTAFDASENVDLGLSWMPDQIDGRVRFTLTSAPTPRNWLGLTSDSFHIGRPVAGSPELDPALAWNAVPGAWGHDTSVDQRLEMLAGHLVWSAALPGTPLTWLDVLRVDKNSLVVSGIQKGGVDFVQGSLGAANMAVIPDGLLLEQRNAPFGYRPVLMTGWTFAAGTFTPTVNDKWGTNNFNSFGFAAIDETVAFVGSADAANATVELSTNGGKTVGAAQVLASNASASAAVSAGTGNARAFYGVYAPGGAPKPPATLYKLETNGTFTPGFAALPPIAAGHANVWYAIGNFIVALDLTARALYAMDVTATSPAFSQVIPTVGAEVGAIFEDRQGARLLLGASDRIYALTSAGPSALSEIAHVSISGYAGPLHLIALGKDEAGYLHALATELTSDVNGKSSSGLIAALVGRPL